MDLDTKFQEATEAVKTEMMDLDLAKMACKDKLKKGRRGDTSLQTVTVNKVAPEKAKKLKRRASQHAHHGSSFELCRS